LEIVITISVKSLFIVHTII